MTVKIVTDSTCDLPQEWIDELDITVVPVYIQFAGQSYLDDGKQLTRQEFYNRLQNSDPLPSTSVPGISALKQTYDRLAANGATQIISIHIARVFSSMVEIARAAAEETHDAAVTVFDSRQLSMGMGFLVESAARAARQGKAVNDILNLLEDQVKRTIVVAALDSLAYLRRSGRMNGALSRLGDLLQIKVLLKMLDGTPIANRTRTTTNAAHWLVEQVRKMGKLERLALVHTNAPERVAKYYENARSSIDYSGDPISMSITPVFGVHLGPGAAGFACVAASK